MSITKHFKTIDAGVQKVYVVAGKAREKGLDPVSKVEIPLAISLAEKAVGLISVMYPQLNDKKIVERIMELEKEHGQLNICVSLKIAEEIAREKYCKFKDLKEAIDAGIRVGFAYTTLGVVSSPLEGYTGLKLAKNKEGKEYFVAYFSGPIRSAGTTAGCVVLMIIDYLRETFGFAKYDPTEDEIRRYVTENYDYHERVTNLQYMPTEEEIIFLAKHLPIQIAGEPTEQREVSNYKDLPRVESNFIRGGMCLIFSEGLAQKAQKGYRLLMGAKEKGFKTTGWDFLPEYIDLHKKREKKGSDDSPTYIKDIVAGRPIFGHPSASGSFRFRYGRVRTSGFSAMAVHPATMAISNNFISTGTQLKIEKPTKGCTVSICENMDGPIVRLKDGSVVRVRVYEQGKELYKDVDEIIYFGDLLVPFGDVANRNSELLKPGYVEEWWALDLRKAGGKIEDAFKVGFEEAVELSKKFGVGLHPSLIYYWSQISKDDFLALLDWMARGEIGGEKLVLPYGRVDRERFVKGKRTLELIGCEHAVSTENVVLSVRDTKALMFNLGIDVKKGIEKEIDELIKMIPRDEKSVLNIVNLLSSSKIKDKAGTFIGARMGRPEKAKLRKLTGSPHVLFPVGSEGGRLRSVQAAVDVGNVKGEFPNFYCKKCEAESVYPKCDVCGTQCGKKYYCWKCDKFYDGKCEEHGFGLEFKERRVGIREYFERAKKKVGVRIEELPSAVKGVRGTTNEDHSCEYLAKGLLRAKYNLNVNKDGTIRFDMTEMPLTHFKPREIGTSIEKLRELGYLKDVNGVALKDDGQVLELMPHDIVLPSCPESADERADDVFLRVAGFVDEELEKIYELPRFFKAKSKYDLIGALFGCIAPHICTATVGRLIGFSKTQALFASPYMHAAMRRDCLGYNNYVSVKENGHWKVKKIGEYVTGQNPNTRIDNFGTLGKKMSGVSTWSNPGQKEVLEVTKHSPTRMMRLLLEDGRKIELTANHKVYVKGKKEKEACALMEGDQVMVGYKKDIEEQDIDKIFLPEIFEDRDNVMLRHVKDYLSQFENISKHENFVFRDSFPIKIVREILGRHSKSLRDLPLNVRIAIKRDTVELPLRIPFNETLLELIGLYIAEGYMRENNSKKGFYHVYYSAQDLEVRSFIHSSMKDLFGLVPTEKKDDRMNYSSRLLYELFSDFFGLASYARDKRIPGMFLNLPKKKIAALLRGYYEGDGSVSKSDIRVACDTISEGLKHDLSFVLSRFGIYVKHYKYTKKPGPRVREFYERKNREVPEFTITKIIIPSSFAAKFKEIGFLSERKKSILDYILTRKPYGMKIDFDENYAYPKIVKIEEIGEDVSYCFNVDTEHNFFANDILVHNCDGDEAAVMLLMDMILNFSRKFLPAHRGGTQDSPLVLNSKINAGEVDDQILDLVVGAYPLELYELAERGKHSSEVEVETIGKRLKEGKDPFTNIGFTHDCDDFNHCGLNSSYKLLPTMQEKVEQQMDLCMKLRGVDTTDVARLVIERHFIRDIRGNFRKFSMQQFRCVACNNKYRRVPLAGKCGSCGGKLIFTIHEGSILKYMQGALDLARRFGVSDYLLECLVLAQKDIESIFGRDAEKQESLGKWF